MNTTLQVEQALLFTGRPSYLRRCAAEAVGTFGLVFVGAIMVNELFDGRLSHLGVSLAFGLIVAMMIYAVGHISGASPKVITQEMVARADSAFTMGCAIDEACPAQFIPAADGGLEDPSGQPIEKVRQIRDQIETKVRELLGRLDAPDPSGRRT